MSRMRNTGNFLVCLIVSLAFNLPETIPAWIALIAYFWLGVPPLWISLVLFAIWFVIVLAKLLIIRWANTAKPLPIQENKNPYSSKGYKVERNFSSNSQVCVANNTDIDTSADQNK